MKIRTQKRRSIVKSKAKKFDTKKKQKNTLFKIKVNKIAKSAIKSRIPKHKAVSAKHCDDVNDDDEMALVVRKELCQIENDQTKKSQLEFGTFPIGNWEYLNFRDEYDDFDPCGSTFYSSQYKPTPIIVEEKSD